MMNYNTIIADNFFPKNLKSKFSTYPPSKNNGQNSRQLTVYFPCVNEVYTGVGQLETLKH